MPVDESKVEDLSGVSGENRPLRVLHAPSHAPIKGTELVRQAVKTLKSRGVEFDYVELHGVPNSQVMKAIAASDIVVDELYSDTYAAMFALEALRCGRPTIVGGYGFDHLDRYVPESHRAPVVRTTAQDLEADLFRLLTDSRLRKRMSDEARRFSEQENSSRAVASKMLKLIRGEAPKYWFFDPKSIEYVHGAGATREAIAGQIGRLVRQRGAHALELDDKPKLRAALCATVPLSQVASN
jgi:hypothetical protein